MKVILMNSSMYDANFDMKVGALSDLIVTNPSKGVFAVLVNAEVLHCPEFAENALLITDDGTHLIPETDAVDILKERHQAERL